MSFALLATARKNSSASSVSKPAIEVAGRSASNEQYGRPLMSIAHGAERLVHRHHRVAVAADPAAVAERPVERLPEHDADVLGRVVRTGLEVAGGAHRQVEPRVAGEQVEHVVEEPDAGARSARARPVELELEPDLRLLRRSLDRGRARRVGVGHLHFASCVRVGSRLGRLRVNGESFGARDAADVRRKRRAPPGRATIPAPVGAETCARRAAPRSAPRRRSAARGWSRRRSRRTPRRRLRRRTRSRRRAPRFGEPSAPPRRPARGAPARSRSRARRPHRGSARRTSASGASGRRSGARVRPVRLRLAPRRAAVARASAAPAGCPSPCSACAARSSATSAGRRSASATTTSSLGPATPSMPTAPDDLALRLLHVVVPGPDDHVHRVDRLGPEGERRDRLRAAHRVDLVHAAQRAGRQDQRRSAPVGPGGVATATSSTPATLRRHAAHDHRRRIRGPTARHVDARPPRPAAPAARRAGPGAGRRCVGAPCSGSATRPHVLRRPARAGAHVGVERASARLSLRRHAQSLAGGRRCRSAASAPLPPRHRAARTSVEDLAHRRRQRRRAAARRGSRRSSRGAHARAAR